MATNISDILGFIVWGVTAFVARSHYLEASYPSDQKYRTFWPRFWAGGVDAAVLQPFCMLINLVLSYQCPLVISVPLWLAHSLILPAYSVVLHAKYGQTVGKWVCKVKVVNSGSETRIGWRQALLRDIVPVLAAVALSVYELTFIFSCKLSVADLQDPEKLGQAYASNVGLILTSTFLLWFFAELVTMLTNKKRRAIHDFIAGTVVVRTNIEEKEQIDRTFESTRAAS